MLLLLPLLPRSSNEPKLLVAAAAVPLLQWSTGAVTST